VSQAWRVLGRHGRRDLDTRRGQRVTRVLELVERFVYDLGLLISGEQVDLGAYVDATVAERLRAAVRPALEAGAVTRPDFGEYAQVRIEGDVLDLSLPVTTVVEFDDRSTRLHEGDAAPLQVRRRVRLQLLLDASLCRVLDHRVEVVS
jgi:hypothetical protein